MLEKSKLSWIVCRRAGDHAGPCEMTEWEQMVERIKARKERVNIAVVGKYIKLHDAYLSVAEALRHGGYENGCKVDIKWIEAEDVTDETAESILSDVSGILVPGGFGDRGIEARCCCEVCADSQDPYFGICLGMQIAVIEFARNVLGITDANSGEFAEDCSHKVIDFMPDQYGDIPKGGTMRLGAYPCTIAKGTILERAYGTTFTSERHRHRYEFNNEYREKMEEAD